MYTYLIPGITLAFAAAVQPGPLFTFLVSKSLSQGWRSTLPAAGAPLISDIPIFLLAIFILHLMPDQLVSILYLAGGIFLFYLSWQAYHSWRDFTQFTESGNDSGARTLRQAVMVNLLNPAPYLGWTTVMGPLFLQGWRETPSHGLALIIGFYTTMLICLALIIILFSGMRRLGPRICRVLLGLSVIALFALGVFELYLGIRFIIN